MQVTSKRLGTREPAPVQKVLIVTVAWGEPYVSEMLSMAWRSLLAPGNLPAFAERFETSYLVLTSEEDRPAIIRSRQFALMSEIVPIEVQTFTPKEMNENKYEWHWIQWRKGLEQARQDGAMVMLIIPDVLYSDGTLARWADFVAAGKRAIFSIGTWVSQETFLPDYMARYPIDTHDSVEVTRHELMDFLLTHMHPLIAASFRESGHGIFHAERATVMVPGEGFASRMFTSQPFLFDMSVYQSDPTGCPENLFELMAVDDVCILSAGPMLHLAEFYHVPMPFDDFRITHLGGWSLGNLRPAHRHESRVDYHYSRSETLQDDGAWARATETLDHMRRDILATHAIAQIWQYANERRCYRASSLIAMAALRADLKHSVAVDGGFTVFLPVDDGFPGWGEDRIKEAFAGPNPEILEIMRDHVVPGRIYLCDGDFIALGEPGQDASSDTGTTLGGHDLRRADDPDTSGRTVARVLGAQKRFGCGTAYLVDRLLTNTGEGESKMVAD